MDIAYTKTTLGNGLDVILHEDHTLPIVAVNVWYHVGSKDERPGLTGFAHLFEHLMFEGSANHDHGYFPPLQDAGAAVNGSTNADRTNYWEVVPTGALELALFLESDRMGFLLDTMSPERVNGQRDVVKNERRQSYENRPYGYAFLELSKMLFPEQHPYSWPTIGYMEDLTAASHEDVVAFFKKYYAPNNASLVITGDIDLDATERLVEKWFGEIPRGAPVEPLAPPVAPQLTEVARRTITDQVQLPRLHLAWLTPSAYAPGDAALDVAAAILTGGKNSRLFKRLVYDTQIAQNVAAFQESQRLSGSFVIMATARPGHTVEEMQTAIDEEMERLRREPPDAREVQRAINGIEASFYRQMERVGGFGGKAEQLNAYYFAGGNPDFFAEDLARYRSLSPSDVQAAIRRWLPAGKRVELVVAPEVKK
jgi:zinc protease